tara:strand:+ start:518 stop:778 length:261 start_codon:yes stop_codon:yes gene_type:complete
MVTKKDKKYEPLFPKKILPLIFIYVKNNRPVKKINKNLSSIPFIKKINKKEKYKIELCRLIPSNIFAAFIKDKTQNKVKKIEKLLK